MPAMRHVVKRGFLLLLGLAVLIVLLRIAGFHAVLENIRELNSLYVLGSIVCLTATLFTRVAVWSYLLLRAGIPFRLRLVGTMVIGFFLGHIVPAKTGEPLTAYLISRHSRIPYGQAVSFLLTERFVQFGVVVLLFLVSSMPLLPELPVLRWFYAAILGGTLGFAVLWLGRRRVDSLIRKAFGRYETLIRHWEHFLVQSGKLIRDPQTIAVVIVLSLAFWLIQFGSAYFIFNGFGLKLTYFQVLPITTASVLSGVFFLLPIGTPEAIAVLYFVHLGFDHRTGITAAVFHIALSLSLYSVYSTLSYFLLVLTERRESPVTDHAHG